MTLHLLLLLLKLHAMPSRGGDLFANAWPRSPRGLVCGSQTTEDDQTLIRNRLRGLKKHKGVCLPASVVKNA